MSEKHFRLVGTRYGKSLDQAIQMIQTLWVPGAEWRVVIDKNRLWLAVYPLNKEAEEVPLIP